MEEMKRMLMMASLESMLTSGPELAELVFGSGCGETGQGIDMEFEVCG